MRLVLAASILLLLAGCGLNGHGLIGNKQACGGTIAVHEPGEAARTVPAPCR